MTNKNRLIDVFMEAKLVGAKYVFIEVFMDGFPDNELIINPAINIDEKLAYYCKSYDDDLIHKFSKGIGISQFGWVNSLSDLVYEEN
jgi:hypothetical protein